MLEKVDEVIFSVDDIDLDDIDSDTTIFFKDGIGLVTIHLNNINHVSDSFDEEDPELLLVSDLWLSVRNLNIAKHVKKIEEELMLIAWHSARGWDLYITKDEMLWYYTSNT